jgi:hypothetical protein
MLEIANDLKEDLEEDLDDDLDQFRESYGKTSTGLCKWKRNREKAPGISQKERLGAQSRNTGCNNHCHNRSEQKGMGKNKHYRRFWDFHNEDINMPLLVKKPRERTKYICVTKVRPLTANLINVEPRQMTTDQKERLLERENVLTLYHQTDEVGVKEIETSHMLFPTLCEMYNSNIYFSESPKDTTEAHKTPRRYGIMLECQVNVGNYEIDVGYYRRCRYWKEWQDENVDSLVSSQRWGREWVVFFPEQIEYAKYYKCNYDGRRTGPIKDMNLFNLSSSISNNTWRYCVYCSKHCVGYCKNKGHSAL